MVGSDSGRPVEGGRPKQTAPQPPSVDASTLFGSNREVIIVHRGEQYRLRVTQNGKLILTK
jgi:hemin uptake protein HemP